LVRIFGMILGISLILYLRLKKGVKILVIFRTCAITMIIRTH